MSDAIERAVKRWKEIDAQFSALSSVNYSFNEFRMIGNALLELEEAMREAREIIHIIGTHPYFSSYDTAQTAKEWLEKYGSEK